MKRRPHPSVLAAGFAEFQSAATSPTPTIVVWASGRPSLHLTRCPHPHVTVVPLRLASAAPMPRGEPRVLRKDHIRGREMAKPAISLAVLLSSVAGTSSSHAEAAASVEDGVCLLVCGEPGVGKTAIIDTLFSRSFRNDTDRDEEDSSRERARKDRMDECQVPSS